jgi:hypothetical protein
LRGAKIGDWEKKWRSGEAGRVECGKTAHLLHPTLQQDHFSCWYSNT